MSDRHPSPYSSAAAADPSAPWQGRRLACGLVLILVILIVTASLIPGSLRLDHDFLLYKWRFFQNSWRLPASGELRYRLYDMWSNFLLYLPLGLLVPLALGLPCPGRYRAIGILRLAPAWGALLGLSMELSQVAIAGRNPDLWDVIMAAQGYLLGFAVTRFAVRRYGVGASLLLGRSGVTSREDVARALRLVYCLLLVLVSLTPLDVLFDTRLIRAKLLNLPGASGHVWFRLTGPWGSERWEDLLLLAMGFLPLGFLARLTTSAWNRRKSLDVILAGGLLAALLEVCQIPLAGRTSDAVQILAGMAGIFFGILLAPRWGHAPESVHSSPVSSIPSNQLSLAMLAYALIMLLYEWYPLWPLLPPREALHHLGTHTFWIPLGEYILHRPVELWRLLYVRVGWFIPLGLMLGAWLHQTGLPLRRRGAIFPIALLALSGWAAFLELGRCLFPGRMADTTNILCYLSGGLMGYGVGNLLSNRRPEYPSGCQQIQAVLNGRADLLQSIPLTFFSAHAREMEFVLLCCRFPQNELENRRMLEFSSEPLDWDFIQKYALQEGLPSLVHHSLKRLPAGVVVPEKVKAALSREAWSYAERNLYLSAEFVKVFNLFKERGIDAVPFKGPVMTKNIYGDLRYRTSGDLDILVHRHDLLVARDLLISHGYSSHAASDRSELEDLLLEAKDFSFVSKDGVHLELHWEILPPSMPFLPAAETLWQETIQGSFMDQDIRQLLPEVQFVLLCVHHGVNHIYDRLIQVCDLDRFIMAYPAMNWDRALNLSGRNDSTKAILLGCLMAKVLLDTPLPQEVLALLRQDGALQRLVANILDWRSRNGSNDVPLSFRLRLYLHIKSGWGSKIHLIKRLLLTPKRVDRRFIKLPAGLRVCYLLVRPVRLLAGFLLGRNLDR